MLRKCRNFYSRIDSRYFSSIEVLEEKRKQLIIIGTGWAGYKLLIESKKLRKEMETIQPVDVIVISERNHFLYTPLLASTTTGTLEFRSIIETVRVGGHQFRNENHFHLASVMGIDTTSKKIQCKSVLDNRRYAIDYDALVIACGARPNSFGIPGVEKYAYFLKEIWDARAIRTKILENFELATQPGKSDEERRQLLHFIVVGGGPTGVEFCAELYDFVTEDLCKIYPQSTEYLKVSLLESREILGMFDKNLREFAQRKIVARPQMEIIKQNCTEILQDAVILGDGQKIPAGLVVWSAGVGPSPLTKLLPFAKAKNGNLMTNEYCQVLGVEEHQADAIAGLPLKSRVFAIGDCAEIDSYPLPATAQVAQSQALYMCQLLNSALLGKSSIPSFRFQSKGLMAYIGAYEGLLQTGHINAKGWKSWFTWRSAYLTKLGSWRLRLQVPIDWLKTFIVGRDVSRF